MKISYFSGVTLPSQNPLSVHVMKMCKAFAYAGHDVTLYARGRAGYVEILKAYDVEGSQNFKMVLDQRLKIPVFSTLRQTRQAEIPDLVYGHDPVALALFPHNVPILLELDRMPETKSAHWAFLKLVQQENFKGIIAISDVLKQVILSRYEILNAEQVFVAHDGADLIGSFSPSKPSDALLQGRKGAPKVGYAGSLTVGKGTTLILRIAEICPDFDFHIVGGTRRQIQMHKAKCKSGNVYFYGFQKHADIPAYLAAFDYVLAPYQHRALVRTGRSFSRWVSPMKLFEYMAARKPILCSDIPVIHEIIQHERNGYLLPAGDDEAWADALIMLYHAPEFCAEMTRTAFADLKAKYTWDKRVEAILEFYRVEKSYKRRPRYA